MNDQGKDSDDHSSATEDSHVKPKSAYWQVALPAGFAVCLWLVLHFFPSEPMAGPAGVFNEVPEAFGWAGIVVLLLVAVVNAAGVGRATNRRTGKE